VGVSPAAIGASRLGGWIRPDSSNGLKRDLKASPAL
jgi:hypothetical protein